MFLIHLNWAFYWNVPKLIPGKKITPSSNRNLFGTCSKTQSSIGQLLRPQLVSTDFSTGIWECPAKKIPTTPHGIQKSQKRIIPMYVLADFLHNLISRNCKVTSMKGFSVYSRTNTSTIRSPRSPSPRFGPAKRPYITRKRALVTR